MSGGWYFFFIWTLPYPSDIFGIYSALDSFGIGAAPITLVAELQHFAGASGEVDHRLCLQHQMAKEGTHPELALS